MREAEKLRKQELELQYDIDNIFSSSTTIHVSRRSENAAKKAQYLEALAGVEDMETTETVLRITESEAVEQQLNYWLHIRAHT